MSFPGSAHIQHLARRVAPKALILLYHRVSTQASDPQLLCVTPAHFAEHLQILRLNYHPISLMSLRRRLAFNLWFPRSVVITFDDGYADNFHQARPLLEAQEFPATIFVTSGKVGTPQEFWWDELERIFLSTPTLPAHLDILIGSQGFSWDLDGTTSQPSCACWNVLAESTPTPRQKVYLDLMKLIHGLDVDARVQVLLKLAAWAGIALKYGRQEHLAITADELRSLPKSGVLEIGAHTVNHPVLSALPLSSQQAEIVESKAALEKILDRPVQTFAYPFGERSDYTRDTANLVRQAGFACACSNFAGQVTFLSDPYQLPRMIVRDWDGEAFAQKLGSWFHE